MFPKDWSCNVSMLTNECFECPDEIAKHMLVGHCATCSYGIHNLDDDSHVRMVATLKRVVVMPRVPGLIKQAYPNLHGRDWLRQLSPEDRHVFSGIGRLWCLHGKSGGMVRALTGKRDVRGRFCK